MTKLEKFLESISANVFSFTVLILIGFAFINIWIGVVIATLFIVCCIFYDIHKNSKNREKEIVDIEEPPVTEYACLNKYNGEEYRLSIFYDDNSGKYRVLDMNNHLILESEYDNEDDAKEHIKNVSEKIIGLKIYNNSKVFS